MELNCVLFPACRVVKTTWISTSVLYHAFSKLYILTELRANDVKFISVDRQKLDLSKNIYIYTYGTGNSIFVEIQPDSTNIENDPRASFLDLFYFVFDFLSYCLVYVMQPCGHLLTLWLSCMRCFLVYLSFSLTVSWVRCGL